MRAKKERCVMLGAWIGGEMGLAEEGDWPRSTGKRKRERAERCSQRGHMW